MDSLGILLIHGFAGTREEVRPLYDNLREAGYMVEMPILIGHEGTKRDLSLSKHGEWVDSVNNSFLKLNEKCEKVIVIGFSMGGLVAVNLYQVHKFDGLVTINTPIYYWDIKRVFKNLNHDFKLYSKHYFKASTEKPIHALLEFKKLLMKTKPLFKNIHCPMLIIQTLDDDTVHSKSGNWIYNEVKGKKELVNPKSRGHVVLKSSNSKEVIEAVAKFMIKV